MLAENVRTVQDNILHLLDRQRGLLEQIEATPDLLKDSREDGLARTLDLGGARECRNFLANELAKVGRLEMVLAVVGTMKAGKSTTINAIVGTEVLPNRNQPMTTLPTLIRHVEGLTQPVLTVPDPLPLVDMAGLVRAELLRLRAAGRLGELRLASDPDGRGLIETLLDRFPAAGLSQPYHGQPAIFGFLKTLNDLMRLARDPLIGIEPPFDAYEDAGQLPVIEVEFFHLKRLDALRHGSFALLDTPGPNEAGQSGKLRQILRDQLARASAVLAVLDYTQLKSEAEAEIRNDLLDIAEQTEDRLFVLVNKFDQKDRNSMDVAGTCAHVAEGLLGGRIAGERVFAVSSRNAYLANRARAEIEHHRRLPEPAREGWVADFAKLALGIAWPRSLHNPAMVAAAAGELWVNSRFDAPIRQIVVQAAAQAAMISLKSALAKLVDYGRRIDAFLLLRHGALGQDVEKLRGLIARLERTIASIAEAEAEARRQVFRITALYGTVLGRIDGDVRDTLRAALAQYFKSGRYDATAVAALFAERLEQSRRQIAVTSGTAADRFAAALTPGPAGTPAELSAADFDPSQPVSRFDQAPAARAFAGRIAEHVKAITQDAVRIAEERLRAAASLLEDEVASALRGSVGGILEQARQMLHHQGFRMEIAFQDPKLDGVGLGFDDLIAAGLSQQSTIRKGRRESQSMLGVVGRWWKGDQSEWGYETVTTRETHYQVDIDLIRAVLFDTLKPASKELADEARADLDQALDPKVLAHFQSLRTYLESFRSVLRDGIEDHRRTERSLDSLARVIDRLSGGLAELNRDVAAAKVRLDAIPPPSFAALPPAELGEPAAAPPPRLAGGWDEFTSVDETIAGDRTIGGDETLAGTLLMKAFVPCLELSYGGRQIVVDGDGSRAAIGRGPDCTVVVSGRRASRRHAEIFFQNGAFMVLDASSNGTFVEFADGRRKLLTKSAELLEGSGKIGLGMEPGGDPEHVLLFRCTRQFGSGSR